MVISGTTDSVCATGFLLCVDTIHVDCGEFAMVVMANRDKQNLEI